MLCLSIHASAYDFEVDGICYKILSEEERTVEVTYSSWGNNRFYRGDIELPKKVINRSKTYTLTSIGWGAFSDCRGLTSLTIPNSVTSIGDIAFFHCSGLTSVTIPNSVTSIGDDAFRGCSGLTSVTIPNSVTSIGDYAFGDCSGLISVTIGNSVTSIGDYAFGDCSGLTSVTIPNSVTSIGHRAFDGCSGLENIYVDPENTNYSSIDGILYSKDATSIIKVPATKSNVTIPNSVTYIGNYAFERCSGLTSVTIPNSVTSIGDSAFSFCSGLTSMTIPNSVTSIGREAFDECDNLKSIYMQCKVPIECDPICGDNTLKEAILYVPKGTKTAYEKVDPWRNFWNIEEMYFNGVEGIEADDTTGLRLVVNNGSLMIDGLDDNQSIIVYDVQGRVVYRGMNRIIENIASGLYIVKAGSQSAKIAI